MAAATVAAIEANKVSRLRICAISCASFGGHSDHEESPAGGRAALLVAPFVGFLLQMGVSRSREYLADETAPKLTGEPGALASGLLHLERHALKIAPAQMSPAAASLFIINPFSGVNTVSALFSTHPPTRLRIARLEAMMTKSDSRKEGICARRCKTLRSSASMAITNAMNPVQTPQLSVFFCCFLLNCEQL
jgi:heat shock protein HtpX